MVSYVTSAGTVWYYPQGVDNILSQRRMAACSKWKISYSTELFHNTGDAIDLCYEVLTKEKIKCRFVPTPEGFHALTVDRNTDGYIFWKDIVDKKTSNGEVICHVVQDSDSDDGIGSDEGVVMDENIKKPHQFAGVTQMDGREVANMTGMANKIALDSNAINTIENRNKRCSK